MRPIRFRVWDEDKKIMLYMGQFLEKELAVSRH